MDQRELSIALNGAHAAATGAVGAWYASQMPADDTFNVEQFAMNVHKLAGRLMDSRKKLMAEHVPATPTQSKHCLLYTSPSPRDS